MTLLIGCAAAPQPTSAPAPRQVANTPSPPAKAITASSMVQIICDNDSTAANASTFAALLTTTPILEDAVSAGGMSLEQWRRMGNIEARVMSNQLVSVIVSIQPDAKLTQSAASAA